MLAGGYRTLLGTLLLLLISAGVGALICKVVHESGHALTALAFGAKIESVSVDFPRKLGFFTVKYSQPAVKWQRGFATLMGTGSTAILAYMLVLATLATRCTLWLRLPVLSVAFVCAWDMFLYATLPLFGLRRGLFIGGRHAEPVYGAEMMGIPKWVFLCCLAVSFVVFHALLYSALRPHFYPP